MKLIQTLRQIRGRTVGQSIIDSTIIRGVTIAGTVRKLLRFCH